MPFEAWAVPWGFRLGEDERRVLEEDMGPGLEHLSLSPDRLGDLLAALRSGAETLYRMPVSRILTAVDRVAFRLLDPGDVLRGEALETVRVHGGFSEPMGRKILDRMARDWTRPPLEALLHAEFPDPAVLDGFRSSNTGGEIRAVGYPLAFHLGAGSVPGVGTTSLIRSLVVKSAVLLKPGRGDVPLPVLFARALQEADPEVGGCVAVLYWPRSQGEETKVALGGADLVVVYGGNETVEWVRQRAPATARLVAYRHRMGVGLVGRRALEKGGGGAFGGTGLSVRARESALEGARAVAFFDQRGCVSPHAFFVEEGGEVEPRAWAELLAGALEGLEGELPSGPVSPEAGAVLQQVRGRGEVEESLGRGAVFHGGPEGPWTVLFQPEGKLEPSCLNRTVRVIPIPTLMHALDLLKPWAHHLQTVGAAGLGKERKELLDGLARLGVTRVTGLRDVPWPPPWWHHDGSGPLRALLRWVDVEGL